MAAGYLHMWCCHDSPSIVNAGGGPLTYCWEDPDYDQYLRQHPEYREALARQRYIGAEMAARKKSTYSRARNPLVRENKVLQRGF